MARQRRRATAPSGDAVSTQRFTIDASVFVNAFNPHEAGHAASLEFLAAVHRQAVPVIIPSLAAVEIAPAVARAADDTDGALGYVNAVMALPYLSVVQLTGPLSRLAATLAATHRLRGADAIYAAVARRYGTTLVSRDREQRARGGEAVDCRTPETAFR